MKVKSAIIAATVILSALNIATISSRASSNAAKVLSTKNIKNSKVHLSSGNIYSSNKLTKVVHNGKNYRHTTFTRYIQVTVKKNNGKKAVYQYIKSGKVKGWIWHSYLKNGTAPKITSTSEYISYKALKITPANLKTFQTAFLAYTNQERSKRGLPAYTEDPDIDRLAAVRAQQLTVKFDHENADGQMPWDVGDSMGVAIYAENIFDDFPEYSSWDAVAKEEVDTYIYHDADSNWGHRDTMLSTDYEKLGNGIAIKNGRLYTAQDYS